MRYLLLAVFFFICGAIYSSYKGYRFEVTKNSDGLQEAIDSNLSLTVKLKSCEKKLDSIKGTIQ